MRQAVVAGITYLAMAKFAVSAVPEWAASTLAGFDSVMVRWRPVGRLASQALSSTYREVSQKSDSYDFKRLRGGWLTAAGDKAETACAGKIQNTLPH